MRDDYDTTRSKMNLQKNSVRNLVLAALFEHINQWVYAEVIADAIGTLPGYGGRRDPRPCTSDDVMRGMTIHVLENRLVEKNCDYRLIIHTESKKLAFVFREYEEDWRNKYGLQYRDYFRNFSGWKGPVDER